MKAGAMVLAQAGSANPAEVVLFSVFAVVALATGLAMVTMRNIVHGALMLVLNFLSIAALFLLLQSAFLAVAQVIVYAGAIMVLFLFVIMLLGVDRDDLLPVGRRRPQVVGILGAALVAAALLIGLAGSYTGPESRCGAQAPEGVTRTADTQPCTGLDAALGETDGGAIGVLADRMFGRYTFAFELAAVLLTVATIGALVLGRRAEPGQDDDPAWAVSGDEPDEAEVEMALAAMDSASIAAGESRPLVTDDPEVVEAQEQRHRDLADEPDGPDDGEDA